MKVILFTTSLISLFWYHRHQLTTSPKKRRDQDGGDPKTMARKPKPHYRYMYCFSFYCWSIYIYIYTFLNVFSVSQQWQTVFFLPVFVFCPPGPELHLVPVPSSPRLKPKPLHHGGKHPGSLSRISRLAYRCVPSTGRLLQAGQQQWAPLF